jgi:hypothetical protein
VATAHDDVARDSDEEFEDAAFEKPGDGMGDDLRGVTDVPVEDQRPEKPQDQIEAEDFSGGGEIFATELVAVNSRAHGKDGSDRE